MDLQSLLEYQRADIEFKKLNDEMTANANYRNMNDARKKFEAAKQLRADSESLASASLAAANGASESLAGIAARVDEVCDKLIGGNIGEEEEQALLAELEQLKATVSSWEQKLERARRDAEKAIADTRTAVSSAKVAKAAHESAKAGYEKFKAEKGDSLAKAKEKREQLAKKVDPSLMATYESLTREGKYPAFVAALGDENSPVCGVCGMQPAEQGKMTLKNEGMCRCEACGRIIYKL